MKFNLKRKKKTPPSFQASPAASPAASAPPPSAGPRSTWPRSWSLRRDTPARSIGGLWAF